jgi:hypothetical protein
MVVKKWKSINTPNEKTQSTGSYKTLLLGRLEILLTSFSFSYRTWFQFFKLFIIQGTLYEYAKENMAA